ncbi:hypothetical protein [Klenkia terrae]|uniref:hypothetical protein n=1 Tax=Klenkia terrae TaxID=1052259 RepID=UPI0021E53C5C|nr:hypothetical protein [Klenkia terrae]
MTERTLILVKPGAGGGAAGAAAVAACGTGTCSTPANATRACPGVGRCCGSRASIAASTGCSGPACTIGAGWSDTTASRVAIGSPRS